MHITLTSQFDGFGHYLPTNRINNYQLEKHYNLEAGWIEKRTGIKNRIWAEDNELLIDLAEKAGYAALNNATVLKEDIGLVILATSTPDHLLPPTSPLLAHKLGLAHTCAYDLSGACSGFLNALMMADGFVRTQKKSALIVAANILSRRINLSDCNSAVLFGDAAAAVVVKPSTDINQGILGMNFLSDANSYELISIAAGGSKTPFNPNLPLYDYKMNMKNGPAIFSQAIKMMAQCAMAAIENTNLTFADIQHFIPHQVNSRIAEKTATKLGISLDKVISIVDEYGNSSAAGIPLALSITHQNKPFCLGEKLLLTSAGAGMTGGAIIFGL